MTKFRSWLHRLYSLYEYFCDYAHCNFSILEGRLANTERFAELGKNKVDGEREILCIFAPVKTSAQIMEDVNKEFVITSAVNGISVYKQTVK